MINRRSILAILLAMVAVSACSSAGDTDRTPLLTAVKISSFRVDAEGAVLLGAARSLGANGVARQLEDALNGELAGIGEGSEPIVMSVKLKWAYIHRGLLNSSIGSKLAFPSGSGELKSEVLGTSGADEAAIEAMLDAYVSDMRELLEKSWLER